MLIEDIIRLVIGKEKENKKCHLLEVHRWMIGGDERLDGLGGRTSAIFEGSDRFLCEVEV